MTFNQWFEQYERDGGELMLYNTIDLEAAFNAGLTRAAEIAEAYAAKRHSAKYIADALYERRSNNDQTR